MLEFQKIPKRIGNSSLIFNLILIIAFFMHVLFGMGILQKNLSGENLFLHINQIVTMPCASLFDQLIMKHEEKEYVFQF